MQSQACQRAQEAAAPECWNWPLPKSSEVVEPGSWDPLGPGAVPLGHQWDLCARKELASLLSWVEDRSRKCWHRKSCRMGKEGKRMEEVRQTGKEKKGEAQETVSHGCPVHLALPNGLSKPPTILEVGWDPPLYRRGR